LYFWAINCLMGKAQCLVRLCDTIEATFTRLLYFWAINCHMGKAQWFVGLYDTIEATFTRLLHCWARHVSLELTADYESRYLVAALRAAWWQRAGAPFRSTARDDWSPSSRSQHYKPGRRILPFDSSFLVWRHVQGRSDGVKSTLTVIRAHRRTGGNQITLALLNAE
jgi:hypothetical protein